jgi:endonuclease-3
MPGRTKLPPLRERIPELLTRLTTLYPETRTALHFRNPFELLIATILSAQCTDARVNLTTPALFAAYPTAEEMAAAPVSSIEQLIKSTGFYRNKAKNIQAACQRIVSVYGGEVPGTLEELITLPGAGRKTANVVLGDGFGITGITVDTHVGRVSRRLGLTRHQNPVKAEQALNKLIPQPEWTRFSHQLILHGRSVCSARKPLCETCTLADLCPKRMKSSQLQKGKRKVLPMAEESPKPSRVRSPRTPRAS